MWDWRKLVGTDGTLVGTGGEARHVLLAGLCGIAVMVAIVNTLDVVTMMHNQPHLGLAGPILWEATGGVTVLLAALIPWALLRYVPPGGKPVWLVIPAYVLAAPLFSIVHVASMVGLRALIYAAFGDRYDFGPLLPGFEYEASKDIFGYFGAFPIFLIASRLIRPQPVACAVPEFFDIRDGARLVRVRFDDILAVASAGNYVEFVLRDGRRPLMRKPLSAMEAELAARGFIRVHRSWLVNAMQVTGLKPEGSGDYEIEVGKLAVPLSRRFPEALARLRAG